MKAWFTLERQITGSVLSLAVWLGHVYAEARTMQCAATGIWAALALLVTAIRYGLEYEEAAAAKRLLKHSYQGPWGQVRHACKEAGLDLEKLFP